MTTRAAVVVKALSFDGAYNGWGYDCPNEFSADLGRPTEAWCGDFVTDIYKRAGLPLPPMQPWCRTGFAAVPAGVAAAQAKGAFLRSWQALPADVVVFGNEQHVEIVTAYREPYLYSIGGNSGPSNVDEYVGQGGVHRHVTDVPVGMGNEDIAGVIAMGSFVAFGAAPTPPHPPPPPKPCPYRLLMLKTPLMQGSDVKAVQNALNVHGADPRVVADGLYGELTTQAVAAFQEREKIAVDGIVGCQTRAALGLAH